MKKSQQHLPHLHDKQYLRMLYNDIVRQGLWDGAEIYYEK